MRYDGGAIRGPALAVAITLVMALATALPELAAAETPDLDGARVTVGGNATAAVHGFVLTPAASFRAGAPNLRPSTFGAPARYRLRGPVSAGRKGGA